MDTIVQARRVLAGPDLRVLEDGAIVIRGGKFVHVGPAREFLPAANSRVIDVGDRTVVPGFVDPHSHLGIDALKPREEVQASEPDFALLLRGTRRARKNLLSGVTTMRLLGEKHFLDLTLRDLIDDGTIPGPRLVVSGPGLTATNGFAEYVCDIVDGVEDIRKMVRRNLKVGVDVIKLFISGGGGTKKARSSTCYYSFEEIKAAVDEAQRVEVPVAAHIHGGPGIKLAAEAGVNTIEHAHYIDDAECELMAKKGTFIVFTLSIVHYDKVDKERMPEQLVHKYRVRALEGDNVLKARKHGVRFAAGTDAMHGMISSEADYLVQFGLSPLEALMAITRNAALVCGLEKQVGTIEADKLADLVVLEKNPLDNINALKQVHMVIKGGEPINISEM